MDTTLAVVLFAINTIVAIAGSFLPKKQTQKQIRQMRNVFVGLGIAGMISTGFQAYRGSKSGEEQNKRMLGDAEHPPFVVVISIPAATKFVITNNSDFPAYVSGIQLHDDNSGDVRDYPSHEFAAHSAIIDDHPWIPALDKSQRHFSATIATRTGVYSEELMLRYAGNDQWARAARVRQGERTLEEDVDSEWPRKPDGTIEWK